MKVLRVLLVDDSALIRDLIRSFVVPFIDIRIIGEAENGHDAVRMITTYQPDVVLMDIVMPVMNGIDAAQAVQSVPGVRILMLSLCGDEEYVVRALRAGAIGYLLKDTVSADLIPALQAAARGEYYFSSPIRQDIITAFIRDSRL